MWVVIYNSMSSNDSDLIKFENYIKTRFVDLDLRYSFFKTEGSRHAYDIATKQILEGRRKFIAVGGDGTVHEVVDAIFQQNIVSASDIYFSVIPRGTGNDWARGVGLKKGDFFKKIKTMNVLKHDVGCVKYSDHDKHSKKSYFLNESGIGFNALVCENTDNVKNKNKIRLKMFSKFSYLKGLLKSLKNFHYYDCDIYVDKKKISHNIFSIGLGIGKYAGKGMVLYPKAKNNDGKFELLIIPKIKAFSVLKNIYRLYFGNIDKYKKVYYMQCNSLYVESKIPIPIEIDGELVGYTNAEYSILHKALNIIV